jgi:putative SOS response-associated peptidase YedK
MCSHYTYTKDEAKLRLTTSPNESVAKYHHRMPFILKPDQYDSWLGEDWQQVLTEPDHAPLEKIQKQAELF